MKYLFVFNKIKLKDLESNEEQPDINQVDMRLSKIVEFLVDFDDIQIQIELLGTTENQEVKREAFEQNIIILLVEPKQYV